jgi:hypothetical protein
VRDFGGLDFFTVTNKGMRMFFSIDSHARPLVLDNINVCNMNMLVLAQNMFGDLLGKHFNVIDIGAALSHDVNGIFAGI